MYVPLGNNFHPDVAPNPDPVEVLDTPKDDDEEEV